MFLPGQQLPTALPSSASSRIWSLNWKDPEMAERSSCPTHSFWMSELASVWAWWKHSGSSSFTAPKSGSVPALNFKKRNHLFFFLRYLKLLFWKEVEELHTSYLWISRISAGIRKHVHTVYRTSRGDWVYVRFWFLRGSCQCVSARISAEWVFWPSHVAGEGCASSLV